GVLGRSSPAGQLLGGSPPAHEDPTRAWLRAEDQEPTRAALLAVWKARLDAAFAPAAWRELERQVPCTAEQDAVLRDLLAQVPPLNPGDLPRTLHPPARKALLAELGRRDPSLAYRAASHLWARDLALAAGVELPLRKALDGHLREGQWLALADRKSTRLNSSH